MHLSSAQHHRPIDLDGDPAVVELEDEGRGGVSPLDGDADLAEK